MKIGINGYEAIVPRFGINKKTGLPERVGSGEYCYQLLLNLYKIDKSNEYFIYLPNAPISDMPFESLNWHYKIIKKRSLWTLFDLSLSFLRAEKIDVFFSPTHYLPIFMPFPSIISILDMSYIKYPQFFKKRDLYQLKLWSKYSVSLAKKIITISESSKDDIIKIYGVSKDKVVVTYPGIKAISKIKYPIQQAQGEQKSKMSDIKKKYNINTPFILFVGTLQPRKNIVRLIEAFSKIILERSDRISEKKGMTEQLNLVLVGKKGWIYEEILSAPKKYGIEEKVKFLDFVPDEDLSEFYKNALCFVLPSLYEGFGLPVLEAMQNGCPVITSNVSSLPEAGGDAALYVDPKNVDDLAEKIQEVISSQKLRNDMIERGYKHVKQFSWEKTAKKTLETLEEIAQAK